MLFYSLLVSGISQAQCEIYSGNPGIFFENQIGYFEDGKIYSGTSTGLFSNQIGYVSEGNIYRGTSTGLFADQVGYIEGNTVYSGVKSSGLFSSNTTIGYHEGNEIYSGCPGAIFPKHVGYIKNSETGCEAAAIMLLLF